MSPSQGDLDRARELDEVAAAAISASDLVVVDGWWCRADPTVPFRRANAALPPVGAGSGDPTSVVGRVVGWYRDRGLVPRVQVSTADPSSGLLDAHLAEAGFTFEAPVTVLTSSAATVAARCTADRDSGSTGVEVEPRRVVDGSLTAPLVELHGTDDRARARTAAYARLLEPFAERGLTVAVRVDVALAAVGFAVVDGRWCGVFGMATAASARRRGAGRLVLGAIAERAVAAGTTDLYLQLEDDNAPAAALYGGVGFEPSHRYHYRTLFEP